MNTKEIEGILQRYYDGETSLAEEKLLKEFFSGGDVPPQLRLHQPLFRFFTMEASETISEDNQDEILIRKLEQYKRETSSVVKSHPGKKRLYYLSGIAAGLLIMLGLIFAIKNETLKRHHDEAVRTSTELAFLETRQALLMVSVGLNTGLDAVQHFTTLDNAIGQVHKFNKFNIYQTQFINPEWMQTPSINK